VFTFAATLIFNSIEMTIDDKKVVSLSFALSLNDYNTDIVEEAPASEPFTFLFGAGSMIPEFEAKLKGLAKDDDYKFMLTKDEAYGERQEEMVV
jgi:FKBP-type peptidyl-prolyl cis-trans isomerase SlyD